MVCMADVGEFKIGTPGVKAKLRSNTKSKKAIRHGGHGGQQAIGKSGLDS